MYESALFFQTALLLTPALVAALGGYLILHARNAGRTSRWPQLITAGLLLGLAIAGFCFDVPIGIGVLEVILALLCGLPLIANWESCARLFRRLSAPRRWDLALLGLGAVMVACAFWQLNSWTTVDVMDMDTPQHNELLHQKASEIAYTDRGREIPLFELKPESKATFSMNGDEGLPLPGSPVPYRSIRLSEASGDSNCVGWVFAAGRYEMQCNDVPAILEDNGYQLVKNPQVGDLVIYRNDEDAVTHAGNVALLLDTNKPLVESKWGAQGVFLHLPEGSPFGVNVSYYRSQRSNRHLLQFSHSSQDESAGTISEDP